MRPHTPLIVPQKYFKRFPLDSIELPKILREDAKDTFKHTVTSKEDDRSGDRGTKMYDSLVASYEGDRELALKKFIQAYLASVSSVDDLVGEILDTLEKTRLDKILLWYSPVIMVGETEKKTISTKILSGRKVLESR